MGETGLRVSNRIRYQTEYEFWCAVPRVCRHSQPWSGFGILIIFYDRFGCFHCIISLSSSNCGNMGIPLCLFAFGQPGMSLAIAYFAVGTVYQFTVALFISHGNMNLVDLFRITFLWGIAAALFFILTNTAPPTWIMNTTELLAGVTIPLMLLTLGASLATLKVVKLSKIVSIGFLKIALGMSVGIATASFFGFEGLERNVLIMQMSMPVAVFSYLLASKYNRNPDEVASLIFITTLLTFFTVPLMLIFLF